jgi:hypothetical protein
MSNDTWTWDGMFDCWIRMPESMYAMYTNGVRSIHMSPHTSIEEKRKLLFQLTRRMGGEFVPNEFAPYKRPIIVEGLPVR